MSHYESTIDDPNALDHQPRESNVNLSSTKESQTDLEYEEELLIKYSQSGNLEAFNALVLQTRGKIYVMILAMTQKESVAWDLTQEVYAKAWKILSEYKMYPKFRIWIYQIAHETVYDWIRGQGENELSEEPYLSKELEHISETNVEGMQPSKVEKVLKVLSPEHRQLITLREINGYEYSEISDIVGVTPSEVMSSLFYARRKMQTLIKE